LLQKIIQKLQDIPEDNLAQLYDLIDYCLGLRRERAQPRTPGLLTGQLGDAFFEPQPGEELKQGNELLSRHPLFAVVDI